MTPDNAFPLLPLVKISIQPEEGARLFVGRVGSRNAIRAAIAYDNCVFAVTHREPNHETPGIRNLYPIGTVVQVKSQLQLPDGLLKVELLGRWRARVMEVAGADGKEIERAIGAPVLWDDRERFYIEHPKDDCVERIREFLADFRARNEPGG